MTPGPALTLAFVGPEQATLVRELMLAAFAEYESVLTVPSSAMSETVEDVAGAHCSPGAVLARLGSETVGSGRFELRDDHVYIGRLSVLPPHRGRGVAAAMMLAMEQRAAAAGFREARIGVRTPCRETSPFMNASGTWSPTATSTRAEMKSSSTWRRLCCWPRCSSHEGCLHDKAPK
ncbi:MAG: GNAT family N-acetyltransferase [Dehalococcoidia bacterium]|nr:GNAT family N-acetyltransferase [Dehalococcoidia bacterium]